MSRHSVAPQRTLSLTEELEKLEQSITLTLQEIDHNFSRAHRIVTTSVLPIVEQYGKHSEAVWEGSKFWKQFFEASANVSLSGYEEPDAEDSTAHEMTQESELYDEQGVEDTVTGASTTPPKPSSSMAEEDFADTSTLDSPSLAHAHSTPRAPNTGGKEPVFAEFGSPYETLRREMEGGSRTLKLEPRTPGKAQALPDMSMTPESSPFAPPTMSKKATPHNQDPVLHRMLDKTYRIAATPHTTRKQKPSVGTTPGAANHGHPALSKWALDSSPPDSPAPQLRANIFSSPLKAPRTPGVSVQTPDKGKQTANTTQTTGAFDSDSDDILDYSPPKTMTFQIPHSRVLQTPAREASKRIVEDLLLTAGADMTSDMEGAEDDSPSVVRPQVDLDDSF